MAFFSESNKPVIAVTMGDPAGIGPEIIAKSFAGSRLYEIAKPVVIGSSGIIQRAVSQLGLNLEVKTISVPAEAEFKPGIINLLEGAKLPPESVQPGKIQASAGKAAFECITKSIELGIAGLVDGVATAPINKEAIKAAKINFIGHTEIYADLTKAEYALTMFAVRNLRVFFLTRHLSLRKACDQVTTENILNCLGQINHELGKLGLHHPKIAVAALNPHAGDGGMFGNEDQVQVAPAVQQALEAGINACGPVPADSVFNLGLQGRYDGILSLYHDQGHIATKTLDFERTISITLGLPFIRTSVDHGTAFDIAGKGIASSVSMEEAIRLAAEYSVLYKGENS